MFDYEVLRIIWWVLLGVLLIGFAIMDGFDLGAAIALPFIAKTDVERRLVINTVGPVWEGNQVWFVLGGGAIFAAWPYVYAVSFSGFYLAMLLILWALILRPVAFTFRGKATGQTWTTVWDWAIFISGFVPALIFGVAVGNVLQGVPFQFDDSLQMVYTGSFFALLNPFALLCGLLSVAMLLMHAGIYLSIKTEDVLHERSGKMARFFGILTIVLFAAAGCWIAFINGYEVTSVLAHDGPSNPLHKEVILTSGIWLQNYHAYPWMLTAPILGFLGAGLTVMLARKSNSKSVILASAISIFGIISTVGLSMFPFILPSSSMPNVSLLVWDASSSKLTLQIMLFATVVFLPIILLYTAYVFRVFRGKVTAEYLETNSKNLY
ncbi:MAG: cytochrome d ubiquinol oxidase subunit II [Gammaproteobacteria bacterium]|nr:cytochrome d ubiquinol oxidase subunit II [Gammaproteobacteria bacterium]